MMMPAALAEDGLGVPDHPQLLTVPATGAGQLAAEALEPLLGLGPVPGQMVVVIGQGDDPVAGPEVGRDHQLQLLIRIFPVHPPLGLGAELPLGSALPGRIQGGEQILLFLDCHVSPSSAFFASKNIFMMTIKVLRSSAILRLPFRSFHDFEHSGQYNADPQLPQPL